MIHLKKVFSVLVFLSLIFSQNIFAEENKNPEPYKSEEFPQALKDIRRFEIITLGSMPFVMLDSNICYSFIRYYKNDKNPEYKPSPFGAKNYTQDEQLGLIFTSLAISSGIGLTDFIVQKIKLAKHKKQNSKIETGNINITPISEDPDAIRINSDRDNDENEDFESEAFDDEVEVLE